MRVRFWGTRGSIPTPGRDTIRYGGNTSCVEVSTADGTQIILDCGSGARELGRVLARSGAQRAHLFVGHTHLDHIQGLPFFVPAFIAGSHLTIYGPSGIDRSLPKAIGGQMEYAYFPVPMGDLAARLDFEELSETDFYLGDIHVRTHYLNHTAPCIGYRLEVGGVVLVYATDHEPHATPLWRPDRPKDSFEPEALLHLSDARHVEFLRDADLVIHDTQYTEDEYPQKVGWGHSTIEYARDVALTARVKRLALFHHDPIRTDEELDRLLDATCEYVAGTGFSTQVFAAAEGTDFELEESQVRRVESRGPQTPQLRTHARVLVADDDEVMLGTLEVALRLDGYDVVKAINGVEAVRLAYEYPFDLILLDIEMPEMDGLTACRTLRADSRFQTTPIVIISARNRAGDVMAGFAEGVTDYMTKPFALSQVRARVRAWLMRSAEATG